MYEFNIEHTGHVSEPSKCDKLPCLHYMAHNYFKSDYIRFIRQINFILRLQHIWFQVFYANANADQSNEISK